MNLTLRQFYILLDALRASCSTEKEHILPFGFAYSTRIATFNELFRNMSEIELSAIESEKEENGWSFFEDTINKDNK